MPLKGNKHKNKNSGGCHMCKPHKHGIVGKKKQTEFLRELEDLREIEDYEDRVPIDSEDY